MYCKWYILWLNPYMSASGCWKPAQPDCIYNRIGFWKSAVSPPEPTTSSADRSRTWKHVSCCHLRSDVNCSWLVWTRHIQGIVEAHTMHRGWSDVLPLGLATGYSQPRQCKIRQLHIVLYHYQLQSANEWAIGLQFLVAKSQIRKQQSDGRSTFVYWMVNFTWIMWIFIPDASALSSRCIITCLFGYYWNIKLTLYNYNSLLMFTIPFVAIEVVEVHTCTCIYAKRDVYTIYHIFKVTWHICRPSSTTFVFARY